MEDDDDGQPPYPHDLGGRRDQEQRWTDAKMVRRQAGSLGREREQVFQDDATQKIRSRRTKTDRKDVEQFDILQDGSPGGTPVISGVLLVRASLKALDPGLYDWLVGELSEPEAHLDERLLVLRGDVRPERLVELARTVRARGYEASVDHLVPLNIVCKGEGGPARTSVSRPTPPAPAEGAPLLALLDTGLPAPGRGHEWDEALATADNRDPLDEFPLPTGDDRLDAAAGHGAFATGIVQQVAPLGVVVVHKAIDSDGVGSEVRVAERLLQAVREEGAEIVNLSLGGQTVDDQPMLAFEVAFELLSEAGKDDVLLVAAAGNYGDTRPCWPAASRRVVSVAALTAALEPAAWSSRGWWVDMSTVGEGLVSTYVRGTESPDFSPDTGPDTWPDDDPMPWAVWTGTSFAAPQVAAEVARRLADLRRADPAATPRMALADLLAQGRRIPDYGVAVLILSGTSVTD